MKRIACVLALWAGVAAAQQAAPDTSLPPEELVLNAIDATPEVRIAEAGLARAEAEQRMRQAGPHEAQLTLIPQRRRVDGAGRYREWEADLSRGVRWPGKARLDREIGASGREAARLLLEDAHHAAARRLLMLWSDWQRAGSAVLVRRQQEAVWQRELDAVGRRVALGDAAVRDRMAIEAALAQARVAVLEAQAEEARSRLALASLFPTLPLPEQLRLPEAPPALRGTDAEWVATILARSHEIGAAAALARQKDAEARRARADRLPDPVLGLRVLDEQGGRERALGVTVSIPLGTAYRGATAAAAGADALAAEASLAGVRRDVAEGARQVVDAARSMHGVWQRQHEARAAAEASAMKAARAYALGEGTLTEVLAARRLAQDGALAERRALVDAIEAAMRVEVDAHERWHRHDDGEPGEVAMESRVRLPVLGGE